MRRLFTAAVVIGALATAATQADARVWSRSDAYNGYGYDSYGSAPVYGGGQTYYNSYNNDHAYGYHTQANRPMDSYSMNKRHLEGWE